MGILRKCRQKEYESFGEAESFLGVVQSSIKHNNSRTYRHGTWTRTGPRIEAEISNNQGNKR